MDYENEFETLLKFFKAMANESRLRMLGLLANREWSVEELAALLKLKAPTVSHHLAQLKEINLVEMQAEGNTHLYSLNREALQAANKLILTPEQMASLTEGVEVGAWEQKVLNSFFEEGRLKTIPASRKKRLVILKWLVAQFQPNQRYPEAEVNEILKRYHPDCATLRREFIGHKLMAREGGIYWRLNDEEGGNDGSRTG
jgi:DNA-binding MarR family transcriptional regulator